MHVRTAPLSNNHVGLIRLTDLIGIKVFQVWRSSLMNILRSKALVLGISVLENSFTYPNAATNTLNDIG
jgi:hypothetical protein